MGILLGLELAAGLLPFFLEELEDSGAQVREQAVAHHAFQDDVAFLVQMSFMLVDHEEQLTAGNGKLGTGNRLLETEQRSV